MPSPLLPTSPSPVSYNIKSKVNNNKHRRSGKTKGFKTELKPATIHELNKTLKPVLDFFDYTID